SDRRTIAGRRHNPGARQRNRHRAGAPADHFRYVRTDRRRGRPFTRRIGDRLEAGATPGRNAWRKNQGYSAGLGQSSEDMVRRPALVEPAAEPAPVHETSEESLSAPSGGAKRVLVVDDNVDSAESMAVLLRLDGHEVRLAHDGE